MEAYSENQIQKLKNNLSVTSLIKNIVRLLGDKNETNNKNKNKLEKIQKDKKLYALKFHLNMKTLKNYMN